MAKDPAFLFYPGDWLGGTLGMTFEEKGAYFELLMLQFNRGHMTSHMIGQTVGQIWIAIKDKFEQDENGLWFNKRLETEQNKRKKYSESRNNNKKGKNQHSTTSSPKENKGHMTSHMENENENENENIINEGGVGETILEPNYMVGDEPIFSVKKFLISNFQILMNDLKLKYGELIFDEALKEFESANLQNHWKDEQDVRGHFTNFLRKYDEINRTKNRIDRTPVNNQKPAYVGNGPGTF